MNKTFPTDILAHLPEDLVQQSSAGAEKPQPATTASAPHRIKPDSASKAKGEAAGPRDVGLSRKIQSLLETRELLDEQTVFEREHLGFMTKWALVNVLPYVELAEGTTAWTRRRRRHTVTFQSGVYFDESKGVEVPIGIPFGIYPRLIMLWLVTTAFRLKTRKLSFDVRDESVLPLKEFLARNGRPITYGEKGNFIRIKDQTRRLFAMQMTTTDSPENSYWETSGLRLVDQASMYSVEQAGSDVFWSVEFTLSEAFYKTIIAGPVPLDIGLGMGLGKSAQALDIYLWLCLQCYNTNRNARATTIVDWLDLEEMFGGETNRNKFREAFKRNLTSVMVLWPRLGNYASVSKEGLTLYKGVTLTVQPKKALAPTLPV